MLVLNLLLNVRSIQRPCIPFPLSCWETKKWRLAFRTSLIEWSQRLVLVVSPSHNPECCNGINVIVDGGVNHLSRFCRHYVILINDLRRCHTEPERGGDTDTGLFLLKDFWCLLITECLPSGLGLHRVHYCHCQSNKKTWVLLSPAQIPTAQTTPFPWHISLWTTSCR